MKGTSDQAQSNICSRNLFKITSTQVVQVPVRLSYLNSDNDDLYKNTYVAGVMAMILKIKMMTTLLINCSAAISTNDEDGCG